MQFIVLMGYCFHWKPAIVGMDLRIAKNWWHTKYIQHCYLVEKRWKMYRWKQNCQHESEQISLDKLKMRELGFKRRRHNFSWVLQPFVNEGLRPALSTLKSKEAVRSSEVPCHKLDYVGRTMLRGSVVYVSSPVLREA